MPDDWEVTHFGNLNQASGNDFDGDGVSNRDEYEQGTNPNSAASYSPRLTITANGGTVEVSPAQTQYTLGQTVTLTAVPRVGNQFTAWSGDATGTTNLVQVVLNGHRAVTATFAQNRIWGWGDEYIPTTANDLNDGHALVAGHRFNLLHKAEGRVRGWGWGDFGATAPPVGLMDTVQVTAGGYQGAALLADGKVRAWGGGYSAIQPPVPEEIANVMQLAGTKFGMLALKAGGKVAAWGTVAMPPAGLSGLIAVTGGEAHGAGLRPDGTVVAWGNNNVGQTNVPAGLTGVVAIASGSTESNHTLALKADGTVTAWGYNNAGQCNVPAGLTNVVAVAAGAFHSMALKSDGTVVAWGRPDGGRTAVPPGLTGVVAIAAGTVHSVAMTSTDPDPLAPVVISLPKALAYADHPFHYRIVGMNGANAFTANGLPGGITLNPTTGIISGTTSSQGSYIVPITSSNGTSTSNFTLELTVLPVRPEFVRATVSEAILGNAFDIPLVEYASNMTVSGLPPGLAYVPATGRVTGTPVQSGNYEVHFAATHSSNPYEVVRKMMTIKVREVISWLGTTRQPSPDVLINVEKVVAGWDHYLALRNDGTVSAWGFDGNYQQDVPANLSNVIHMDAGNRHNIALKRDGTLVAWGQNNYGQTNVPASVENVLAVATGFDHHIALLADGTVVGWGQNSDGQLNIPAGLSNVVAIDAGSGQNLALRADGTVVAWGANNTGQGVVPGGLSNVVAIVAGHTHNVALKGDGTAVVWGGTNTTITGVAAIAESVALKHDGTVVGIGNSVPAGLSHVAGISGRGTGVAFFALNAVSPTPRILSPSRALAYQGSPFRFRLAALNQPTSFAASGLPDGLVLNNITGIITGVPSIHGTFPITVTATNATASHEVTLTLDVLRPAPQFLPQAQLNTYLLNPMNQQAVQFHSSASVSGLPPGISFAPLLGQLSGSPQQSGVFATTFTAANEVGTRQKNLLVAVHEVFANINTPPVGLMDVVAVTAGYHTLALRRNGTVSGWGWNHVGQASPPAGLTGVVAIAAGVEHSLALKSDGTVVGWGNNNRGQVSIPAGLTGVVRIATRDSHCLALKSDGTVVGWGQNDRGQVSIPVGLDNVIDISAGGKHALALKADGTLAAWGWNFSGQTSIPAGIGPVIAIATGPFHNVVVKADGTLFAWGNSETAPSTPGDYLSIAVGEGHTLALRANGTVLAWGSNARGETSAIAALSNVRYVAAQHDHSVVSVGAASLPSPVPLRRWRFLNFSSLANAGAAADTADEDHDGIANLIEFATGSNPSMPGTMPGELEVQNEEYMDFLFDRSVIASTSVVLRVEWSDSLPGDTWSSAGVTETIESQTGDIQRVKASVPKGGAQARFVRLSATPR